MRMRWVRHVTRMGEMRNAYRVFVGSLKARDHLEDLGIDREFFEMDLEELK
jgi:hypothetical protein